MILIMAVQRADKKIFSNDAHFVVDVISRSSEVLYRGFCEITLLQSSNSRVFEFASNVKGKALSMIQDLLFARYDADDCAILTVDCESNFVRAIPCFSTIVAIYDVDGPRVVVIGIPILKEIIWAEKDDNTYIKDSMGNILRAKVSSFSNSKDILVDSNINKSNSYSRNFGSFGMGVGYVALGRLDVYACKLDSLTEDLKSAARLIVQGARGKCYEHENLFVAKNNVIRD